MRRILSGPTAVLLALATLPAPAWAQVQTQARTSAVFGPAPAGDPPADDADEDVVIIEDEMEGEAPADAPEPTDTGEGALGDLLDEDARDDTPPPATTAPKGGKDSEAKQIKAEMGLISVVQRQRMLKKNRFELQPQFGISVNDPYVRHYTIGLDMNYWFHNRMAIGVTGTGFIGALTPRYENIRYQEGLLLTANEVLWQASVNFLGNPFYGKIAIFNRALLHWEASLMIGGGVMQTRVIPRYPPLHDPFTNLTGGGHFGLMSRFYIPNVDWFSFNAGVRTWVYADKLEPYARGPNTGGMGAGADIADLDDPDNAKAAADWEPAFNVVVFLGVSFFLPTSFQYKTPR